MRAIYDVAAPAKLNLFLHVAGRREDGYHLLQSLFVPIDWSDTIHLERRDDGRLQRHDLGPALPARDLVLRAAHALQQASGCAWGADLHVMKTIPAGAGLGGGSSDAASTLLALNRLWELDWPLSRLLPLGLSLGADVPFFLGGTPAWVEGVGERLTPVALPRLDVTVIKPVCSLETARVFAHPEVVRDGKVATISDFVKLAIGLKDKGPQDKPLHEGHDQVHDQGHDLTAALDAFRKFGRNDLETAAMRLCPQIGVALSWLDGHFGHARMTGSGSAVFALHGLGPNEQAGGHSAVRMADHQDGDAVSWRQAASSPAAASAPDPQWLVRSCRTLGQHPLAGWAQA